MCPAVPCLTKQGCMELRMRRMAEACSTGTPSLCSGLTVPQPSNMPTAQAGKDHRLLQWLLDIQSKAPKACTVHHVLPCSMLQACCFDKRAR